MRFHLGRHGHSCSIGLVMRTLWTSLLLALALVAGFDLREARACDLQDASSTAWGKVLLGDTAGPDGGCHSLCCGPVAAESASDDADGDREGSGQGPERVDSDASLVTAIGLDGPSSSAQLHPVDPVIEPDTPAADRTQQPPRR